jgi:hypothetical protein
MTLTQFRDEAVLLASEYGIGQNYVTIIAGIYGHITTSSVFYSIKAWDNKKLIHIHSALSKNPETCLESFSDELKNHFKQYDQTEADIELS